MQKPVLYVLGAYPRWSETFIRQDLMLLQRLGVPVLPVALAPGDVPAEPGWPRVACLGAGLAPGPHQGARRFGGRRLGPGIRTRISLLTHRRVCAQLCRLAQDRDVGHVHGEFADLPGLLAAAVGRRLHLPHSVGVHARDIHACKYSARFMFGKAAFVTVCNVAARARLETLHPPVARKTHLIHHGLILSDWPYAPHLPQTPGTGLLFVGRFVPKKGLADLIAALALLFREKETDARLTIAGDGPDAAALRARAEALGVAARISWLGVVPREHLRTQLRQHTCLVVPSTVAPDGDRDGIPNVVLEAMAVGTPVVGTDAGSLPEVLSPETGWVCEPQNPAALAALIRSCSGNSAERARRGARARQQIETRFDAVALARQRAALFGVCPDA